MCFLSLYNIIGNGRLKLVCMYIYTLDFSHDPYCISENIEKSELQFQCYGEWRNFENFISTDFFFKSKSDRSFIVAPPRRSSIFNKV